MKLSLEHPLLINLLLLILPFSFYANPDLQTLLTLKSSMLGPTGSGLTDWSLPPIPFPSSHCSFSGVTCDTDLRVTSLNISSIPLFGTIPPEIGLLANLVNLTLTSTNLTGLLPFEMSNLSRIRFINLSANSFGGEFPGKMVLPMKELEVFDSYNNNFTGNLPVEFSKLSKLKVLYLGGNYFSGPIPEEYGAFPSLRSLGLQGNELTGAIPASLSKLPVIEELWLGYFNTYEGGIPAELGEISTLKLLDIGGTNITGEIPASLGNLKMLHTLFLQYNSLTGTIPPELSGCDCLMSLDLSVNELHGEIPESFERLKNLTLLNLFSNRFAGPIPAFIGDLPNLETLQIWENNFTFELPENLGKNGRLLYLDVSLNHLTGVIPNSLCIGGKLKTLILMQNYFLGTLPDELGNCPSLIRIRVGKNFFNGSVPGGFFNLPNLSMLELNDNYFTGELPAQMSSRSIESVILSNNWITGRIPAAIGNLVSLDTLALQENRFFGEIPDAISDLKMLDKINVSGNNISGEIPASIGRCSRLTSVDLSGNQLVGGIPREILGLPNMNILNVSRNQLSGEVPSKLGHMKHLTVLDLSYNNFSGNVPTDGQLKDFDDSIFAGNPNLCSPRHRYYPLPIETSGKSDHLSTAKLAGIVIASVTVFLIVIITFWMFGKRKLENSKAWKLTAFQRLDFKVEDVVECLRDENIIGKGGAGVVYRGSMPNGEDVAIKCLTGWSSGCSDGGFSAEIQTLGRIRHRNIVRLLGYVSNKDTNLLLYEYMSNGSLGESLHGPKGAYLQWERRYRIAVEAAKGLCYLHHDYSPVIVHRDVKSNNILLDSDYEAHVADFGLAKFLKEDGVSECMSAVAGSYGYIAPEYAYTLKVDEKIDVYSFGVVLLELVVGKKPVGDFGDGVNIVTWVRETVSELSKPTDAASVLAVLDPRLTVYMLRSVINLFKVAMMCLEDEAAARPTMREVVHMLTNRPESPPRPPNPMPPKLLTL